jgi:hypothetical protein
MEDLQIRWRRLDHAHELPVFHSLDSRGRNSHFDRRGHRHRHVVIDRFVMIESDLGAFAPGLLLGWGLFRFAVAIRRATAFRARPHEVFVA